MGELDWKRTCHPIPNVTVYGMLAQPSIECGQLSCIFAPRVPHRITLIVSFRMAYKDSGYTVIAIIHKYNFGPETHVGDGDTIKLCHCSSTSTFVASTALTKGPQRF